MLKLHKTRRALPLNKRRAVATVGVVTTLFAGALIAAPQAQANVSSGGCRTAGYAGTTPGVNILPCAYPGTWWANSIQAYVQVQNPNRLDVNSCAQLLRVNGDGSTTQVTNFGCNGPSSATGFGWYSNSLATPGNGTYVVQTGYWYAGQYWGGAQSARITIY
ncbi:hypothetical protein ABZ743_32740 [Streptomyces sp. NPDC006662]|uniref:hypothetical protein n=1 Tax=Streptomyces sp. NPDC006662 TaxID=3156902 RepID=UPI0033D3FEA4